MYKRIVDGEGVWRSDKLARVKPVWVRAEYANLLPLALANGVFEAKPGRIWSLVYSYNRPDITRRVVETVILPALKHAGLLFTWREPDGKDWGFWVGIEKSGRLPSASRLRKKHESVGPAPPVNELEAFIRSAKPGQPMAGQRLADGQGGFGSGNGFGNGMGNEEGAPRNGAPDVQAAVQPSRFAYSGAHFCVLSTQDRHLGEAFPWVDRVAEYKKADSWLEANPNRRPKKIAGFLHNWFSRIQAPSDSGGGYSRAEERTRSNLRAAGLIV